MSVGRFLQQAAAGNAGEAVYVDDVFSTYLYEGNGTSDSSTNQIQNGLDLNGEGGLVWIKKRSGGSTGKSHTLVDSERGDDERFKSETNDASFTGYDGFISFNSDGFTVGKTGELQNANGRPYVSWSFRKQPGFFDVVAYTGTGSAKTVSHNLGSVPGMIIVKRRDSTGGWRVYHRGVDATAPEDFYLALNSNDARSNDNTIWNDTAPTSTEFTIGTATSVNASGGSYIAYLFAHDAQDFGTDSDESIIKCGSYDGTSSTQDIELGFEPQWLLIKSSQYGGSGDNPYWIIVDMMREMSDSAAVRLTPNSDDFESTNTSNKFVPKPTGFQIQASGRWENESGYSYVYVAIRRPQKPASEFAATDLFDLDTRNGVDDNAIDITGVNFPVDAALITSTNQQEDRAIGARLTGKNALFTNTSGSQSTRFETPGWDHQDGVSVLGDLNKNTYSYIDYFFRRAPGFFDVVTYTGTGSQVTVPHNLGVVPQLILNKPRTSVALSGWYSLCTVLSSGDQLIRLDGTDGSGSEENLFPTAPTAENYYVDSLASYSSANYISYLFATVPGISKVGTYSGTGATQTIDCGFSSGARFVLIKCTSANSTSWFVFDSVRGITTTPPTSPFITLNSNSAESSSSVLEPDSTGFKIIATGNGTNGSGQNYLFLAIA